MGKTFSIKVLFGIYLLLMAGKVFAFSCNVDGGSSIGAGTTSVYVNLDPVIQPGQNLVVDLSQHISCWNDYGGWYDTDHINLVQGSAFAGSLQSYKGSLYWNNVTYPFPLTTNTNVLDIGDKTPMPLPLKLYITPVGAAGGVVIKSGEVIARIHMYKIATLGSGNPRNFTWNIISNNSVVMPTGGCTVDSRNVTVNLPDFPGSAEIPLGVITVFVLLTGASLWVYYFLTPQPEMVFSTPVMIKLISAAFTLGFAYAAWNVGILHGNVTIMAVGSYFTPVLSSALAAVLLSAPLSFSFWQGALMVCGGSLLCWLATRRG